VATGTLLATHYPLAFNMGPANADVESVHSAAGEQNVSKQDGGLEKRDGAVYTSNDESRNSSLLSILEILEKRGGVELRGCTPVPYENRTVTQYWNIFSLWFCMSCNLLPYVTLLGNY